MALTAQVAAEQLQLVAGLIITGFGTRIFYVSLDGFDTHADQAEAHRKLLAELADGITQYLQPAEERRPRQARAGDDLLGVRPPRAGERQQGHRPRRGVVPVRGRAVGQGRRRRRAPEPGGPRRRRPEVPHDFRRVYATLLDGWLGCDSKAVLGGKFEHVDGLKPKKA